MNPPNSANSANSANRPTLLALILLSALPAAAAAWQSRAEAAETGLDELLSVSTGKSSIDRLARASSAVKSEAALPGAEHQLSVHQRITGARIETTKFQHYFRGIEVVGS
ncbi:MAG: hypothetical protein ACXWP5_10985, partial [Bdellovibrionota bacterium]